MSKWFTAAMVWTAAFGIVAVTCVTLSKPARSQAAAASSYTWDMYAAGKRGVDWPQKNFPLTDQLSNIYPPECRQDLGAKIDTPIQFMARAVINYGRPRGVWPWMAAWRLFPDGHREIWVDQDLTGYERWDAIQHERCHELLYRMTGKSMWHDDRKGKQ